MFAGCFLVQKANAQFVTITGTVYDITAKRPLEAVAVLSTSGRGAVTDSLGRYLITVHTKDSIWFSMIGKATMKYPVDTISNTDNFNIMIHVRATELPEVKVRNNYYKYDSVQNRKDYAKVFDFKKPGLRLSNNPGFNPGGLTVGFDLDEIINMFRTKRNRSLQNLQMRLVAQEQEKYVNRRFSRQFVRKLTGLASPELDSFMNRYRPDYGILQTMNDLELGYYIEKCHEQFRFEKHNWRGALRRKEE
ncbi:MAG: hypothetical protein NVSMB63_11670 [Sediminibacterium sp.]